MAHNSEHALLVIVLGRGLAVAHHSQCKGSEGHMVQLGKRAVHAMVTRSATMTWQATEQQKRKEQTTTGGRRRMQRPHLLADVGVGLLKHFVELLHLYVAPPFPDTPLCASASTPAPNTIRHGSVTPAHDPWTRCCVTRPQRRAPRRDRAHVLITFVEGDRLLGSMSATR